MKCPSCGAEVQGKFCAYCGSEMPQEEVPINITNNYYGGTAPQEHAETSSSKCPKCGSSKILFKRERIGTAVQSKSRKNYIDSGRQGQSVSHTAYRTIGVCQGCGYTWVPNAGNSAPANKASGRKTWLWVLGWIFIFLLPLTILLLRKTDMKPFIKYGIIAAAWILFLALAVSGKGSTDALDANSSQPSDTSYNASESLEPVSDNQSTEGTALYATDEVVNRFITEFNNSAYEITDIRQGNIKTKFFGFANGIYLEMLNANNAAAESFCLTVNGSSKDTDKQSMYTVFREAAKILDSTVTDEMIDTAISGFEKEEALDSYISDGLLVVYAPTSELSSGRIDMYASDYK